MLPLAEFLVGDDVSAAASRNSANAWQGVLWPLDNLRVLRVRVGVLSLLIHFFCLHSAAHKVRPKSTLQSLKINKEEQKVFVLFLSPRLNRSRLVYGVILRFFVFFFYAEKKSSASILHRGSGDVRATPISDWL